MSELTRRQAQFCAAMLLHKSQRQAAAACGLSERQAKRYAANPVVQRELRRAQDVIIEEASMAACDGMSEALATLRGVLSAPCVPPAVQIRAAHIVLQVARELHEERNLVERISALERQLEATKEHNRGTWSGLDSGTEQY